MKLFFCVIFVNFALLAMGASAEEQEHIIDQTPAPGKDCIPGWVYRENCNTCICGNDGYGHCTLMICHGYPEKPQIIYLHKISKPEDDIIDQTPAPGKDPEKPQNIFLHKIPNPVQKVIDRLL
ncbi:uncharacterized protein LOC134827145 [Culicoides brevitarsis]|uniref:uncharacterized protein LOC134827145 n=1 Tax=Culicoides brevitarsis TaxID=469753 RepID=UPI00307BDAF0